MIAPLDPRTRLSAREAAAYLGRAPNTLQNWRSQGTGPAYIAGHPVQYRVEDLEAYLDSNRVTH